jgi:hypothetical protein
MVVDPPERGRVPAGHRRRGTPAGASALDAQELPADEELVARGERRVPQRTRSTPMRCGGGGSLQVSLGPLEVTDRIESRRALATSTGCGADRPIGR